MDLNQNGRRPPRIGLDGFNLALEQGTGISTYARNLSHVLKGMGAEVDVLYGRNIPSRRDLLKEMGFFDPNPLLKIPSALSGVFWGLTTLLPRSVVEIPMTGRVIADDFRTRLPAFDRLLNSRNLFLLGENHFNVWGRPLRIRVPRPPQVMHWTYPLPIEIVGAKNIYTLHDLVPLRLPYTTIDHNRRYLALMRFIARRADHIVTVSEASRADIINLLGVSETRVTNTYQAVEFPAAAARVSDVEAEAEVLSTVGLPHKGYFLFFGAIEPKKNVGRLIEAFLSSDVALPLLIVGKRAWKASRELKLLKLAEQRSSNPQRVVHIDYIPQALLISLIRGARAVIFPSLYEGFGLPVLEAMKLGTPVITSTAAALPEVAGDAALLVDPYDLRAITNAARRLETDPALCAELSARGLRQAEKFSTDAYRERLAGLYAGLGVSL